MTISTKFNFKFATLINYSSKKTTLNITLIREDQQRKKIKGNKVFYNLTSSNISKIDKRKITISRKHHIIINDTSTSQMSKCFQQRRSNITKKKKCSSNKAQITWPDHFVNNWSPTTMTDQMFIKYLDIQQQSRTEAQNIKIKSFKAN